MPPPSREEADGYEALHEDDTIWLTQKLMATLFDVTIPTINEHLKNIYETEEINRKATIRKFRTVQSEDGRDVSRNVDFYNLDAKIPVGYTKSKPPRPPNCSAHWRMNTNTFSNRL